MKRKYSGGNEMAAEVDRNARIDPCFLLIPVSCSKPPLSESVSNKSSEDYASETHLYISPLAILYKKIFSAFWFQIS